MIKILLLGVFSLTLSVFSISGQNRVSFTYDAAGNRIKREIILTTTVVSPNSNLDNVDFSMAFFEDEQVKIYPDPIQGKLTVEAKYPDKKANAVVSVYNHSGEEVLIKDAVLDSIDIDMSNLIAGIYFMDMNINNHSAVWKVIKQ